MEVTSESKDGSRGVQAVLEGEEVTEEYFPSVQVFSKDQRRIWLMEHYWFDCQCYACDKDMPQIQNVPSQYSKYIQNFIKC